MSIYHSRLNILVAKQALHFPDINPGLKQVRRKTVAESMNRGVLRNAGFPERNLEWVLNCFVTDMMTAYLSGSGVY
jgi:hypothetical protein